MWIVLEGIDGSGKTTLARWFAECCGWKYGHTGPPGEGGAFPELARAWWQCEDRTLLGEHWVWDRGHLGELFCGPVRRGTTLTDAAFNALEALLLDRDTEIWWLDPPATRVQSEVPLAQRASERLHLKDAVARCRVPVRRFASPQAAGEFANQMGLRTRQEVVDPAGVGTRRPRWWALGEQCSRSAMCCLPFTTPAGMDMLWPHVDPTRVRVSNVLLPQEELGRPRTGRFEEGTLQRLRQDWAALREPKVLALGGTAEAALRAAGVPVAEAIRHPQYVRRFYHLQVGEWSRAFLEVVR